MKLLTKNTDYAVRALITLAGAGDEFISARDVARGQNMPYQFIRKILGILIKEGLVESREGGKGGFKLKARPKDIKVTDIINIFQGKIQLSECIFRKRICENREKCVLRKEIRRIEDIVGKEFSKVTIAKLAARE
ncbi:MAG: Rrf2 family transcriptional regulator [Candidatus Omnitrophota bacterium]